jgi:hypothetical protein
MSEPIVQHRTVENAVMLDFLQGLERLGKKTSGV